MKRAAQLTSLVALMATLVPSVLYFGSVLDHTTAKNATLIGSVIWFIATPLWMGREVDDAIQTEF